MVEPAAGFSGSVSRHFPARDLAPAERLGQLVEETYYLVEAKVPGVDVNWLRSVFRLERPPWGEEGPPVHPTALHGL